MCMYVGRSARGARRPAETSRHSYHEVVLDAYAEAAEPKKFRERRRAGDGVLQQRVARGRGSNRRCVQGDVEAVRRKRGQAPQARAAGEESCTYDGDGSLDGLSLRDRTRHRLSSQKRMEQAREIERLRGEGVWREDRGRETTEEVGEKGS